MSDKDGWKIIPMINSDADHARALERISELMDTENLSQAQESELVLLAAVVEQYEGGK